MSLDVFLSFARGDREIAAFLARRLETLGVSVWYDARLVEATAAGSADKAAVESARIVALLFSEECNRSERMQGELALAEAMGKPVLPFLLEDTVPRGALLHGLADRFWLQAHPEPLARIDDMAGLLARLVGKASDEAASPPPMPAETLYQREEKVDVAIGAMLRDVVRPAAGPALDLSPQAGPAGGHGGPVKRPGRLRRMALNVLTLGVYGVVAQRRATERFRANIRKL